ncbi:carbohydrate ABC transporter permease [Kribbella hippodromi]|uniref:Carbohydrate ABC transporter permease n=1 Tax=Kribbella hippodromi TaxID=434347 RepID=A0ABP4QC42_9ACTN
MTSTLLQRPVTSPRPRVPGRVRRSRGLLFYVALPAAWSLAVFDIFIVVWLFVSSLKTTREVFDSPFGLPSSPQWQNYQVAWESAKFGEGVGNSLLLVFVSGIATLLIAAPAAYVLSRFQWRLSGATTVFFAMGLGIPAQTLFIPLFVALDKLHLVNTMTGLIIVCTGTGIPFAVFFLTAFFASLPKELEEAAAIDGCSPPYTFWRIMLPLTRSGLLTLFVLQAIGHWGETLFALILLQDKTTISLSLLRFMQTMQYNGAQWSVLFAGIGIIVIPLVLLYLWMGSRLIEGIASGYGK